MPTKNQIKANFQTGDTPTQSQFEELIDASFNINVNLNENPRWFAKDLIRATSSGTGHSGGILAERVSSDNFNYDGYALSVDQQSQSNWFVGFATPLIYNDSDYQEANKVSISVEVYVPSAVTGNVRFYAKNSSSEPLLASQNGITLPVGVTTLTQTVTLGAGFDIIEVRFFASMPAGTQIGRVVIKGGENNYDESEIDKQIGLSMNVVQRLNTTADSIEETLLKNPRWVEGIPTRTIETRLGFFGPVETLEADGTAIFGYEGTSVNVQTESAPNFGLSIPASRIYEDAEWQETGQVTITVEMASTSGHTNKSFRIYGQNDESEPQLSTGNITLNGSPTTVVRTVTFASGFNELRLRWFGSFTGDIQVGRVGIVGGAVSVLETSGDIQRYQNIALIDERIASNDSDLKAIIRWGDSLTSQSASHNHLGTLTGRSVTYQGFGGERSYQIRDRYLAVASTDRTVVFWVGRNNFRNKVGWTDEIVRDVRIMVDYLTHDRFVVCMPPNGQYTGEYVGTPDYDEMVKLEQRLESLYGQRFVNVRRAVIEGYDYRITELTNSYTQPSVGSSVSIVVDDVSAIAVNDEIRIGMIQQADKYTVTAKSGNTLTCTLDAADNIATGTVVENTVYNGPSGAQSSVSKMMVITEIDYLSYQRDTMPKGALTDNIHLNAGGHLLVDTAIDKRLKLLKF